MELWMPSTRVLFYKELDGAVPFIEWLEQLKPKRVRGKCLALVKLLASMGYELHRPRSDALRDGLRELRTEVGNVNYRVLYFFHGKDCVVLTHGITKEDKVPDSEINRAIAMKDNYQKNPDKHTYYESEQYYEEST
jgi:putative component of toxin-antitoxin plasmid stabilization module